jgi:CDP-diacylglycerol---serine O-phosphatidyltransferase
MDIRNLGRDGAAVIMSSWRYIPNFITLLGMCAGLTAIPMAIQGQFGWAIAAIIAAAILDGIDGSAARLLNAHSEFGAELDSLADFVSFGVAPSVTIYLWGTHTMPAFGWLAALVFAAAAALRLARFNVNAGGDADPMWKRRYFTGVPTPAGAIMALLPLYLEGLGVSHALMPAFVVSVYSLLIAGLMVSSYPAFSPKFGDPELGRKLMPVMAIAGVAGLAALIKAPYLTLFLATLLYGASIPLAARLFRKNLERDGQAAV